MQTCLLGQGDENRVILGMQTVPYSPLDLSASARARSLMSPMQTQGPFLIMKLRNSSKTQPLMGRSRALEPPALQAWVQEEIAVSTLK